MEFAFTTPLDQVEVLSMCIAFELVLTGRDGDGDESKRVVAKKVMLYLLGCPAHVLWTSPER